MSEAIEGEADAQITGLADALPKTKLALVTVKRCRTCQFSEMEGKDRTCRYDTPKIAFIPVPVQQRIPGPNGQPMIAQGVEVRPVAGWPVVPHDAWCRLWQLKHKSD